MRSGKDIGNDDMIAADKLEECVSFEPVADVGRRFVADLDLWWCWDGQLCQRWVDVQNRSS
jgi:hypothetical protein